MGLTANQQAIVDASTKLLSGIFSLLPADVASVEAAVSASLGAANAAQAAAGKAGYAQIIDDSFGLADAIAAEIGNQKVTVLIADLQKTEQDALAGKVFPVIADVIADYKDIKVLASK